MDLGQLERPVNWERALLLFEEIGDLPGQAGVLNMLGGFAYFKGDWDEAVALYRRAQATARRTGNAVMDAFYVFNIGEIALEQGRLDEAEEAFVAVNRTWRAAGYRSRRGRRQGEAGPGLRGAGPLRGSVGALRVLHSGDGRHREPGDAFEASARMAECRLLSGDDNGALELAERCLAGPGSRRRPTPDPLDPSRARSRTGPAREGRTAMEASRRACRRPAAVALNTRWRSRKSAAAALLDLRPESPS